MEHNFEKVAIDSLCTRLRSWAVFLANTFRRCHHFRETRTRCAGVNGPSVSRTVPRSLSAHSAKNAAGHHWMHASTILIESLTKAIVPSLKAIAREYCPCAWYPWPVKYKWRRRRRAAFVIKAHKKRNSICEGKFCMTKYFSDCKLGRHAIIFFYKLAACCIQEHFYFLTLSTQKLCACYIWRRFRIWWMQ